MGLASSGKVSDNNDRVYAARHKPMLSGTTQCGEMQCSEAYRSSIRIMQASVTSCSPTPHKKIQCRTPRHDSANTVQSYPAPQSPTKYRLSRHQGAQQADSQGQAGPKSCGPVPCTPPIPAAQLPRPGPRRSGRQGQAVPTSGRPNRRPDGGQAVPVSCGTASCPGQNGLIEVRHQDGLTECRLFRHYAAQSSPVWCR